MPDTHRVPERVFRMVLRHLIVSSLLVSTLGACQALPVGDESAAPYPRVKAAQPVAPGLTVVDTQNPISLQSIVPKLAEKRVVFVGETHDNYQHHLNQLAIIESLHAHNPDMAIGMEFFQTAFQPVLDDFIAGKIDEQTFLEKSEYYDRWQYDYRLYQPIMHFARDNGIPLIALNLPHEITKKVGKKGLEALSEKEKQLLPKSIDREVPGYRERIEAVFSGHPGMEKRDIEHFIEAQLLWDEGMAEQAANYLNAHPTKKMVILAGAGHIMFGSGIPVRLQRRINAEVATVLTNGNNEVSSKAADYILFSKEKRLPKSGLIGVMLEPVEQGMKVISFSPESTAEKIGMKKDDRIVSVEGRAVQKISDIRLSLWDNKPGDKIQVTVMRDVDKKAATRHEFEVVLK